MVAVQMTPISEAYPNWGTKHGEDEEPFCCCFWRKKKLKPPAHLIEQSQMKRSVIMLG